MSFTSLRHIFNKGFGEHTYTYVYLLTDSNITFVYFFSGLSGEARLKQIAQKAKKGKKTNMHYVYIQRLDGLEVVWHEIFASGFFHESVSSWPLNILLGPIFTKIRGNIRNFVRHPR